MPTGEGVETGVAAAAGAVGIAGAGVLDEAGVGVACSVLVEVAVGFDSGAKVALGGGVEAAAGRHSGAASRVLWPGGVTGVIDWFALLFTGQYPEGLYNFGLGVMRWSIRVEAYMLLMTEVYPPFSLE